MHRRKFLTLATSLFLLSVGEALHAADTIADGTTRQVDAVGQFSYVLPAQWRFVDTPLAKHPIGIAPPQDGFSSNVVTIREAVGSVTLEQYVKANEAGLAKVFQKLKVVSRGEFKTAGGAASYRLTVENEQQGVLLRQTFYFFVEGERQFTVTCTAKADGGEAYDAVFAEIMESFRIEPPAKP